MSNRDCDHSQHNVVYFIFYANTVDINNHVELGGGVSSSPLQLYYQPGATQPEAFAWLTQPGVYYGDLSWDTAQHSRELDLLKNHRLLPYSSSRSDTPVLPLSVVGLLAKPARLAAAVHTAAVATPCCCSPE